MNVTENGAIATIIDALHNRALADHPVKFWLRDDDAVQPSASLDRLLELTETFCVPLTLAVIPACTGEALAQRLATTKHVSVAVHGWSHFNYAYADEKKQELGNHRPLNEVLAELHRGFTKLAALHHSQFVPLLVPPWNRISADIVKHLSGLGFAGLSTFGEESSTDLPSINAQVDIIDWKGTRGGRDVVELASEIVTHLRNDRSTIGVLSHHLVHDEIASRFLEQLFDATSGHPGARWLSVAELLEPCPE